MQKTIVVVLCVFAAFLMQINTAISSDYEYQGITKNQKIISALNILKNSEASWVINTVKGDNLSKERIRIMFRQLEKMNPGFSSYEALTCVDSSDKIYIFINSKHKDAPAEAIAALLTHEVLHQDDQNSIAEETQAWSNEATYWISFCKNNPTLASEPSLLVKRLNKLASIYKKKGTQGILNKVMAIPAYKELEMASAGFDY